MKKILFGVIIFFVMLPAHSQEINWGEPIVNTDTTQLKAQPDEYEDNGLPGVRKDPYTEAKRPKTCEETSNSTRAVNSTQGIGDCYRSPITIFGGNDYDSRTRAQPN